MRRIGPAAALCAALALSGCAGATGSAPPPSSSAAASSPLTTAAGTPSSPSAGSASPSTAAAPSATPSPRATRTPTGPLPKRAARTKAGDPIVYLTFDDGPSPEWTPALLDLLTRHHAVATFFVKGSRAQKYPEIVQRTLAQGSEVASHTWRHPRLTEESRERIRVELESTQRLLGQMGASTRCFRPPFGATNSKVQSVAASLGIHEYLWTTESLDWSHPRAKTIYATAEAGLEPGAVLVFHDGRTTGSVESRQAVDRLLREIERRGYVTGVLPC